MPKQMRPVLWAAMAWNNGLDEVNSRAQFMASDIGASQTRFELQISFSGFDRGADFIQTTNFDLINVFINGNMLRYEWMFTDSFHVLHNAGFIVFKGVPFEVMAVGRPVPMFGI